MAAHAVSLTRIRLAQAWSRKRCSGVRVSACASKTWRQVSRPKVLRCATVDVSVRELRNHTARVIAAIESGEPVVLTVHGRPVADIVPRQRRSERRPTEQLLADLSAISDLAAELNVASDAGDFDVGLTTDDMTR
jgi:prevent-host-death family protein